MILFIGPIERGFFVQDIARSKHMDVEYIESNSDIHMQINPILEKRNCKYMIYDLDQYTNPSNEISQVIKSIQKTNNATVIIYAPGWMPEANALVHLRNEQFYNFILGISIYDVKDQTEKCMNGYYENNPELLQITEAAEEKEIPNCKLIGVAGAEHRIGTTTQAIQITKFLIFRGYKACYIQMNNSSYIDSMKEWLKEAEDDHIGKITCNNIDMYYNLDCLSDVLKSGYDFYVYDYATYTDIDFNKTSFLEKDIRIFVCGASPTEMNCTLSLIGNSFYNDVTYIFNLVPEADQEEILDMMMDKSDKTFFTEYTPDPFVLHNPKLYDRIIPLNSKTENKSHQKHTGKKFFRKQKRNTKR